MTATSERARAEALVERYLAAHAANDLEGVVSLFAEEASLEDPVGAPALRGAAAIRAFYRAAHGRNGRLVFERIGPVLVGGDELAFHVLARLERAATGPGTHVVYTLHLDGEGRIRALRAHF